MSNKETKTPLTDAAEGVDSAGEGSALHQYCVSSDFARTLEKKLTAATAQLEEARKALEIIYEMDPGRFTCYSMPWSCVACKALAAMQQKEGK